MAPTTTSISITLALDLRSKKRTPVWNLTLAAADGGIRRPISSAHGDPAPVVEASRWLADNYGLDVRWSPIPGTDNMKAVAA